jgi:hypothetical protein
MSQAHGQTPEQTLDTLLMRTGPLSSIKADVDGWKAIAGKLREAYPKNEEEFFATALCTAYYKHGKDPVVVTKAKGGGVDQVEPVRVFLERFMELNDQWPYIRRQPWYLSGEYVIAIDINYYPDRTPYKGIPAFHKDTGGTNLFVNLIFDNVRTIEATEWFADLADPSSRRAQWQEELLPPVLLKEMGEARKKLEPMHKNMDVSGGVAKGDYIFVSWVDDLVWHATPSVNRRLEMTEDLAGTVYPQLKAEMGKSAAKHKNEFRFQVVDGGVTHWISALSVLGSIAECPTTKLYDWLAGQQLAPQDLTNLNVQDAWRALYGADRGKYDEDVRERAKTPWRVGTATESIAYDVTVPGSKAIKETPVGLSGRRRTNSTAPEEVAAAELDNRGVPRTFIRSWVRVLSTAKSKELTTNNVAFG